MRFDIEESFLDDQSNGWNVQKSQIRSVWDLSRRWFIVAIATLFVTAQGIQVVTDNKRRWVDTHWSRGNSYFRIGWDWLKTAVMTGWHIICRVSFSSNRDADPVVVSRQHHEQQTYRFEFKVLTYAYDPD